MAEMNPFALAKLFVVGAIVTRLISVFLFPKYRDENTAIGHSHLPLLFKVNQNELPVVQATLEWNLVDLD